MQELVPLVSIRVMVVAIVMAMVVTIVMVMVFIIITHLNYNYVHERLLLFFLLFLVYLPIFLQVVSFIIEQVIITLYFNYLNGEAKNSVQEENFKLSFEVIKYHLHL